MKKERILAFMLAVVVIVTSIQLPAKAATTEPGFKSGDTNVAEEMLVILDDGNTCLEYKDNTTLNVGPNNRGEYDKISFGETNSFVYSANVTFSELVQAHGSIRLVVGKGTIKSGAHAGKKQYIELCIRPGISGGQEVFFSNGIGLNDSGEGVFDAKQATGFDELGTYRYTIQYENGVVSFWVSKANSSEEAVLVFSNVNVGNTLENIELQPGFFTQECKGTISDIKIWGDVKEAENWLKSGETLSTNTAQGTMTMMNLQGVQYGQSDKSYGFSVKASVADNTGINYEGLRFKIATVKQGGNEVDVQIGLRPEISQALILVGGNPVEWPTWSSTFGTQSTYVVKYHSDNSFSFYKDGQAIFKRYKLNDQYTDMKPAIGLGGEFSNYSYSDLQIWGNQVVLKKAPTFKEGKDTNALDGIVSSGSGDVNVEGIIYGDSYKFSVKASITDNTGINYEGLRFKLATVKKDGAEQDVLIGIRPELSQALLFVGNNLIGFVDWVSTFSTENTYTIEYNADNTFSFYKDGVAIFHNCRLSNEYTDMKPSIGLQNEGCTFTYADMKLWGDVQAIPIPEFDSSTDTNVMEKVHVSNPLTGVTGKLTDCSVSTENESGTNMDFYGIQYGDTYNFSAKALFKDNSQYPEWSHEGLRFKVATAEKDGAACNIEVRVRSSMVVIFANDVPLEIYTMETEYGKEHLYTLEYKGNGLFSFYKDRLAVVSDYQLSNDYKNITPCVGIGSEVCAFSFSEMKLWGDLSVITAPEFNSATDTNIMEKVYVGNPLTGVTEKLPECSVSTENEDGTKMTFYGIQYGDSYTFSAKASFKDNSQNADWSHEGLRFEVATAEKDGTTYDIEVRVRSSMIVIFANDIPLEIYTMGTEYNKAYLYTLEYKGDGLFSFYRDGLAIFLDYQLSNAYKNVVPCVGIGSEVCAFEFSEMKLWGDMTVLAAPEFNSATDENIISKVSVVDVFKGKMYKLSSGKISSDKNITGRVDFEGITIEGNYRFYADGKFEDNKKLTSDGAEYNWESLVFRIAKAQKKGKEYTIEVRVRKDCVLVYAVEDNVGETLIYQEALANSYGVTRNYIVNYQRDGIFDLWQNGVALLYGFDITEHGYTNVKPAPGIGCEVCSFTMSNMKLVSEGAKIAPSVPEKPATNGDYADTMWIPSSFEIVYEDGVVSSLTDETYPSVTIDNLPFKADETYVLGFNLNVKKAEKAWMGPRIIFGTDSKGDDLFVYLTEGSIVVAAGAKELYKRSFSRSLYTEYRVDLLVEPDAVSVWVDDILLVEECKIPNKATAKTGILFEQAIAILSNFDMYYTDLVKYVAPKMPEKPVLKNIGANQYNAAEWMKVELNGKTYTGYFGNKLSSKDSSGGTKYTFENLPITDEMSYYYSATYTVHESNEVWKGPRFIFRHSDKAPMYVAITQTGIQILAGSTVVAATPFKMEIGKSYDIVMYSTPTAITVWIDGKCALESVDLSEYCKKGVLKAQMGILFELCKASVTNLAIYGDKVVFNSDYVDIDLYNDKFYRMKGIPEMPRNGINLFQNITMIDNSQGSLGASFDKNTNVLMTEYKQGVGQLVFVDANGSRNLNGLKNESGYVFSFVYEVKGWEAKTTGDTGFWVYLNRSSVPSTTQENRIGIGISGDTIMLVAWQDGQVIVEQTELSKRQNNKDYQISVVHGKNWIKLYVDNVLTLVATDLPTYNLQFDFEITNMSSVFKDFKLYEFENSGLSILPTKAGNDTVLAGNTIFDAKEYSMLAKAKWPIFLIVGLSGVLAVSVVGISYVVASSKKRRKTGTVEQ